MFAVPCSSESIRRCLRMSMSMVEVSGGAEHYRHYYQWMEKAFACLCSHKGRPIFRTFTSRSWTTGQLDNWINYQAKWQRCYVLYACYCNQVIILPWIKLIFFLLRFPRVIFSVFPRNIRWMRCELERSFDGQLYHECSNQKLLKSDKHSSSYNRSCLFWDTVYIILCFTSLIRTKQWDTQDMYTRYNKLTLWYVVWVFSSCILYASLVCFGIHINSS